MSKEPNTALLWALLAAVGLILIGWMPIMLRANGWAFLPSTTWVERSYWPAMASAAFCAIVPSVIAIRGRTRDGGDRKSVKYLSSLALALALFGTLGHYAVSAGGPMLYAWAAGQPTEMPFVVERAKRSKDWKCGNQIMLRDLPMLTSKLCGLSEEVIANLRPGQTVLASGKGSSVGVLVSTVGVTEAP